MSMYQWVCGNNPLFGLYARILETAGELPPVPRFRDMYTRDFFGQIQIVIYTRTGGGNRSAYAKENLALAEHPLYVDTFDDSFDGTFANFVYFVPEEFRYELLVFHREFVKFFKGKSPEEKFQIAMNNLKGLPISDDPQDTSAFDAALAQLAQIVPGELSSLERDLFPSSSITRIVNQGG